MTESRLVRVCQQYCCDPLIKSWGLGGWLFFVAMWSGVIGGIGMQLEHRWSSWHWADMFREKPVVVSPDFFFNTSIVTFFLGILYQSAVCIKRSYCQEGPGIDGSVGSTSSLIREAHEVEESMSISAQVIAR